MDDDALHELLTQPLESDSTTRRGRWIPMIGVVLLIAVLVVVFDFGDDEPSDTTAVVGSSIETTTTTFTVQTTTPVSSFQYPDGRLAGTLVYDPTVDGTVMIGGWTVFRAPPVLDPWVLDTTTLTWVSIAETFEPSGRELAPATFVDSLGSIAVFGGTPDQTNSCGRWNRVLDSPVDVWTLDTSERVWERLETLGAVPDRWGHAVAYDPRSDVVVMFGGVGTELESSGFSPLLGDTWIFDPATTTWEAIETDLSPAPRACPGMVYDPVSESILVWGGTSNGSSGDASIWRFDTAAHTWTESVADGSGPESRWLHEMVVVGTRAIVVGGFYPQVTQIEGGTTTEIGHTAEVWSLDLTTDAWERLGDAPVPMSAHAATENGGGTIVVVAYGSTLLYDPVTDEWTDITPYDELDWPALGG